VQIMTVHQAKGLQWPAVLVPQLVRNRFPSRGGGGRTPWHLLPAEAFENAQRYEGGVEDERRLFYVAVTRAQKFLHLTWAPTPGNQQARAPSDFFTEVLASKYVKRRRQDYAARNRLAPAPRASVADVVLSFSELKYFFECPYQFKLRVLYGFNAPLASHSASASRCTTRWPRCTSGRSTARTSHPMRPQRWCSVTCAPHTRTLR
jgi:DNA helicase-2/ATP-dependent DNA helicase PcrA